MQVLSQLSYSPIQSRASVARGPWPTGLPDGPEAAMAVNPSGQVPGPAAWLRTRR